MRKRIRFYFEVELKGALALITSTRRRRQRGLSFSQRKKKNCISASIKLHDQTAQKIIQIFHSAFCPIYLSHNL